MASKVSQEESNQNRQAEETISLVHKYENLKENETLSKLGDLHKEENLLLKEKNQKMEEVAAGSKKVIEDLHAIVERDTEEISYLKKRLELV